MTPEPPREDWFTRQAKRAADSVAQLPSWLSGPEKAEPTPCVWRDDGTVQTSCGRVELWPTSHFDDFTFCPYCGHPRKIDGRTP